MTGANFILLGRCLDEYGPEAQPVRADLGITLQSEVDSIWPEENGSLYGQPSLEKSPLRQAMKDMSLLKPTTEEQRTLIPQMRSILLPARRRASSSSRRRAGFRQPCTP